MKKYLLIAVIAVSCHTENKKTPPATEKKVIDTAAAIHNLETKFSQHPDLTTGLTLANLYAETKNEKALALCDALLAKDTARELTDAVFIKGIYYSTINDTIAALHQFDECIKRDWKFIEAYIEKGIIRYDQKNFTGAVKTFELAVKVANTYPDAYYWLGKCQEAIGQKEEALANYSRALALDKDFTEAKAGVERLN